MNADPSLIMMIVGGLASYAFVVTEMATSPARARR